MNGDVQVRFCEQLRVKTPGLTRLCDTVEGAQASSLLYSLTLTAKLNGKDPFEVMTEIFKKLPLAKTIDDYEKLAGLLLSEDGPPSCRKKEGALIQ
jgi:hypothetical protein